MTIGEEARLDAVKDTPHSAKLPRSPLTLLQVTVIVKAHKDCTEQRVYTAVADERALLAETFLDGSTYAGRRSAPSVLLRCVYVT